MAISGAVFVPHPPLIVPAVGHGREQEISSTTAAYREAADRTAALAPDVLIVTSPHATMYADYFHISPGSGAHGDFGRFGAPDAAAVRYDGELSAELSLRAQNAGIPAGTLGEREPALDHGTLVPLHFLQAAGVDCPIVRIGLSGLPKLLHYRLGQCIAEACASLNRRAVWVASGDLSHKLAADGPYGFAPEGPRFDAEITEAMRKGDFLRMLSLDEEFCEAAAECGLRSFVMAAGAFDGLAVKSELLSHEGPFGVGYAVCCVTPQRPDDSRRFGDLFEQRERKRLQALRDGQDAYARLARLTVEAYVHTGHPPERPDGLPGELLRERAGVFVSLKKDGRLRGCIGTIAPVEHCVADEILRNAVSACAHDPRFDPVEADELPSLTYSVDVLGIPEPVQAGDELDAKEFGVIVMHGRKRGLLLPNLAGVDTPEQQISIALQKAGISPDEPYCLERFRVVRHR